ncbi:proline-rich proteoglycan 2-like [Plectropomus leopardus]|uniref:proline-rich proteoglycan 2-like n=1 Tax=Plectropomus leopardus TaxID=160734 RepID=UPI001C4CEBE0|nr:proline-rich proteoglycan 2-like [Plectropomus leopardus]
MFELLLRGGGRNNTPTPRGATQGETPGPGNRQTLHSSRVQTIPSNQTPGRATATQQQGPSNHPAQSPQRGRQPSQSHRRHPRSRTDATPPDHRPPIQPCRARDRGSRGCPHVASFLTGPETYPHHCPHLANKPGTGPGAHPNTQGSHQRTRDGGPPPMREQARRTATPRARQAPSQGPGAGTSWTHPRPGGQPDQAGGPPPPDTQHAPPPPPIPPRGHACPKTPQQAPTCPPRAGPGQAGTTPPHLRTAPMPGDSTGPRPPGPKAPDPPALARQPRQGPRATNPPRAPPHTEEAEAPHPPTPPAATGIHRHQPRSQGGEALTPSNTM